MAAQEKQKLWSITPFEKWVEEEGLPIIGGQYVYDVAEVKLAPWERTGCYGALLDLESDPIPGALVSGTGLTAYLCDIPPRGKFKAEKHLYEEVIYIVKGVGGATIWNEGSRKHTFEWQEGSLFATPLNAWHELYNGQGSETARLLVVTNAPAVINLYRSRDFVYRNAHVFSDRFTGAEPDYFNPKGKKLEARFLETNFVANVKTLDLDAWSDRGPGKNMMFMIADGALMAHVSEFPVGTYKKAHSHHMQSGRGGFAGKAHILVLSGEGYDLQWPPADNQHREKINWKEGTLFTAGRGYHQHFNTSNRQARYLAFRTGNPRYSGATGTRYKMTGGEQIEFAQEDPEIRGMFIEELKKQGIPCAMPAT
ncbi:MAG TPA: cupin domain-containing protein [Candidatus Binatia bacterium]|jgi:quercetin dioxygenase-like cupin family protein